MVWSRTGWTVNWGVQLSGRLIVVVKGDLEGEKIGGRLLPTGCPEALYILKEMVATHNHGNQ